jgi:hypothetical protein
MVAGAVLGGLTLLFFMGLVLLSVAGHEVPCNSTFLVNITLSLGAALAVAFLGGNASATGAINIPLFKDHPLAISLSGGVAVLVIMLAVTSNLFGKASCGPVVTLSCPQNFQAYPVEPLRFGFCYPREGWEVDAGAIGVNAADIYLRSSSNRDIGVHFHVSLIPAAWAGRPEEYTAEVAKTWKQLDTGLSHSRSFVGGRAAYNFQLKIKDRQSRQRPTEVTQIYLDPERLLEVIATWFENTPSPLIEDMQRVKSTLTFARV